MISDHSLAYDFTLFFKARIEKMMAEAIGLSTVLNHPGLKGAFRELLLRELLEPLLPHTCRLASGTVVGYQDTRMSVGKIKTEDDDILIVDGECLPLFFERGTEGVYPIESVLSRIEVKTTIDKGEIQRAVVGARNFATLDPQSRIEHSAAMPRAVQVLFGFKSGFKTPHAAFVCLRDALLEGAVSTPL